MRAVQRDGLIEAGVRKPERTCCSFVRGASRTAEKTKKSPLVVYVHLVETAAVRLDMMELSLKLEVSIYV